MPRTWIETKVELMVDEINALGMSVNPEGIPLLGEELQRRVTAVSQQLGMTEASARKMYFDDDTIREMARAQVAQFADERPGQNISSAEHDTALSRELAGTGVAALAEALRVRLANDDPGMALHVAAQYADLLAMHGVCLRDAGDEPVVSLTSAWLHRAARLIEAAAEVLDAGGHLADESDLRPEDLAALFRRDAALLRARART